MEFDFRGKVAIVTGAGGGLGRSHALALAARGARVVVNDPGTSVSGASDDAGPAAQVGAEIERLGGEALVDRCDVTDAEGVQNMVATAVDTWGRVDILINNAGILRDRTFAKMDLADFRRVVDVHLWGAVHCTKAVWPHMVAQGYGRILMTSSASGIYGNFGQSNYGAAKAALVGLTNVLAIEGERKGIRVNALAPTAATRMTDGLLDEAAVARLGPEAISPGAVFLVSEQAPNGVILGAGAGVFAVSRMQEARPVFLPEEDRTAETIAARWDEISDLSVAHTLSSAFEQTNLYVELADRVSAVVQP
ncbi:SDR family NAD(P)-dependent oxidoreductase [Streptomyces sp. NPDC003660]